MLRGNLAPDGAVIKHTAAERRLLQHAGPAVVFRNYNDLAARIDDPALPVTADSVLVLQNAGPLGGPGMPEWGMLPIPKKLLAQGVRDMVRISDARMSGTSYGACVLHVAPESFVGGPLAFVRDGDIIELDVPARRLDAARRRRGARQPPRRLETARGAVPARIRTDVRPSRHPGRPRLRLRFSRGHGADRGAGNTLAHSYPLSAISYQLSAISYQLSAISSASASSIGFIRSSSQFELTGDWLLVTAES